MQSEPMSIRTKALLMNLAILTGLIVQCIRGKPISVIAYSGIFILVIANSILMAVAKSQNTPWS